MMVTTLLILSLCANVELARRLIEAIRQRERAQRGAAYWRERAQRGERNPWPLNRDRRH